MDNTASPVALPPAWIRRKSVRALRRAHARHQREEGGLRRVLGFWSLVAIGIGCTIGAGIFVLPGVIAATKAGPGILLSFLLAGVACAIAALCYAELAVIIPASGSAYSYTYATLGELAAWLIGWNLLLEYGLSNSAVAAGWGGYLSQLLDSVGLQLPARLAPGYRDRVSHSLTGRQRPLSGLCGVVSQGWQWLSRGGCLYR